MWTEVPEFSQLGSNVFGLKPSLSAFGEYILAGNARNSYVVFYRQALFLIFPQRKNDWKKKSVSFFKVEDN